MWFYSFTEVGPNFVPPEPDLPNVYGGANLSCELMITYLRNLHTSVARRRL